MALEFKPLFHPEVIRQQVRTFPLPAHVAADTGTLVSAKPKPRSHSAGLLRSERQLLANPPFNDSDWFRKDDDVRWHPNQMRLAGGSVPASDAFLFY